MERREFLKLFGLGAVAVGIAAATMSPAQAASAAVAPPAGAPGSVDAFLKDLSEANGGEGQFSQYYIVRRRRRPRYYYRPRYYVRRRRCFLRRTIFGWQRVCY